MHSNAGAVVNHSIKQYVLHSLSVLYTLSFTLYAYTLVHVLVLYLRMYSNAQ